MPELSSPYDEWDMEYDQLHSDTPLPDIQKSGDVADTSSFNFDQWDKEYDESTFINPRFN